MRTFEEIAFVDRELVVDEIKAFRREWIEAAGDLHEVTLDLSLFFNDLIRKVRAVGKEEEKSGEFK